MINYILKGFTKIVLRMLLLMTLLVLVLIGFLYFNYRYKKDIIQPNRVFAYVDSHKTNQYFNEENKALLDKHKIWAIRLNEKGQVVEDFKKPTQVQTSFSIQDVARFTRYYLEDYPVFTYTLEDGLLVLAYPKGTLDKFPANYYHSKSIVFDLQFFGVLVFLFLLLIYWFYRRDIKATFKKLGPIQEAIDHLYDEDYRPLEQGGDLGDLSKTINSANETYVNLKRARAKWIRGVSHDLRTPLAKISWGINELKDSYSLKTLDKMHGEVLRISSLIEDLNLTMYLESLNQDQFVEKSVLPVLRKVVIDKLNDMPSRKIHFENKVQDQRLKMDEGLFYRMIENILNNSLAYTQGDVWLETKEEEGQFSIEVKDQGQGISQDALDRLENSDLSKSKTHGLGLFISKQICDLHNGKFKVTTTPKGTCVSFIFKKIP